MKTSDIQQAVGGFETVAVIGGPLVVRIHKALDVVYADSRSHGFFISIDFKFRRNDALHIGTPGWEGLSKTESTREANALANQIHIRYKTLQAAKEQALNSDTFTNRYTVKVQEDNFNKLIGKFDSEFVQP